MKILNERGVIMVTTLLFIVVIAAFFTVLFARMQSETRMIEMQTNRIIAFQMAESGIDDAISELTYDADYTGTGGNAVSLSGGVYTTQITTPDPANNPEIRQIISNGFSPSNDEASYAYQMRSITTFVRIQPKAMFDNAVFAEYKIKFKDGAVTDSYNSSDGPYGGENVGAAGDIAANTIEASNIQLIGNSMIQGNATVGSGGNPAEVIQLSEDAVITGSQMESSMNRVLQPVEVPDGISSSGAINLNSGDNQNLTSGTYLYDSIQISSGGHLTLEGPVTFYVTGDITISGGEITTLENIPSNFIMNVAGHPDVMINGSGNLYGVVYAPEAGKNSDPVIIKDGAEIFGAVVAYEVEVGGTPAAKIHYDTSLSQLGGRAESDVILVSWQES